MGSTIKDVAAHAGVSISTVSRVLNDTCHVDKSKQRRVLVAVEELGYLPNPAARSLLSQTTGGLGIILPFVSGEFFSEFLNGIDSAAQTQNRFLLISTSHGSSHEIKAALAGMRRRVDGLLVMAPQIGADASIFADMDDTPIVFVNSPTALEGTDSITFDNFGGMYANAAHLISKGHRKIGFLRGPADAYDANERFRGYTSAMRDMGIDIEKDWIVQADYTQKAGYDATVDLVGKPDPPTALMCPNDYAAAGALRALHEVGLSVPDDMAVTGFDDVPSARYTQPSLTTIHVPVREMGSTAIKLLVSRLSEEGRMPSERRLLPIQLIAREST